MTSESQINRRQFLIATAAAGGGLMLEFFIPSRLVEAATVLPQPWTPASASGAEVNAWLIIGSDDTVTIRVAQSEMGQGAFTAMPMLIAEELACDWQKVRAEYASANRNLRQNRVYQRMATGGSRAVRGSREYLQQAGASARARLIAAAAQSWGVPAAECRAENGMVLHPGSGRKINYGAVAAAAAAVTLDTEPAIKTPDQFTLLGKSLQRIDVPAKVNGTATYGSDVRLPDMLYAAVAACPVFGGRLKGYDFEAIKGMPGVHMAVEVPHGIAVVANSFWRAKTALESMPVEWDFGPHAKASSEDFWKTFHEALDKPGTVAKEAGDALAALETATRVVEADYEAPYLAHATMEPMNCTAQVTPQRVDVWVGTQNPEAVLAAAADITGVGPEHVYVHTCFLGGGFGRRSNPDDVRQAVTVAKALGGRPVQLLWTREEDMRHGFYRPMAAIRFRAALDANGAPVAYFNRSVTHSILSSMRPGDVKGGIDRTSVEGLANTPYGFPQLRIEHLIQNTPVPVWFWRSVGASQNAFAVEGFINELAFAAGKDPVEFRRQLLQGHADWLHVLDTVAQKANWGKPMPPGMAQGVAIAESYGSIVAEVAEVAVSKRGEVRVERVVCAIDSGHVVNPLNVAEQIEGSVAWGLTAALYGQITIKDGRVVEGNFDDYPMLRLDAMPEVETHLALTGGSKWGGVGEPGVPPLAPAVCHGVFQVTGKRIRSLPLRKHDLNWT
jgi:isoquinoline 1-oxidoreductase beta subunit